MAFVVSTYVYNVCFMCGLSEGFASSVVKDSWCVLVCDLKMFEIVCLQGEVKIVFAVIVFIMLEMG